MFDENPLVLVVLKTGRPGPPFAPLSGPPDFIFLRASGKKVKSNQMHFSQLAKCDFLGGKTYKLRSLSG